MKIAILGYGTIGSGVYNIINSNAYLHDVEVMKILDKRVSEDIKNIMAENFQEIVHNSEIDLIVETMGAGDFSYQCIKEALLNRKHVVTANKEVIADHLDELFKIAKDNNVSLLFEASCGGGIPLIKPLMETSKTNSFSKIIGILNGTTNYCLTLMRQEKTLSEAIKLAQEKGFAESDPSNDLEGLDMVRKISIISDICYHSFFDIKEIYHYGISNVCLEDINYAISKNMVLKYIAMSQKNSQDVEMIIEPVFLSSNSLIANTNYEFNIIKTTSNINDELMFYGKGAGKYPTANAIINDIIAIKENHDYSYYDNSQKYHLNEKHNKFRYYVRFKENFLIDEMIDEVHNNQMITKMIDREILLNNIDKIEFYARIEDNI